MNRLSWHLLRPSPTKIRMDLPCWCRPTRWSAKGYRSISGIFGPSQLCLICLIIRGVCTQQCASPNHYSSTSRTLFYPGRKWWRAGGEKNYETVVLSPSSPDCVRCKWMFRVSYSPKLVNDFQFKSAEHSLAPDAVREKLK